MIDKPHILIVDDDAALLQALPHTLALRISGVQADTSASAQGALELIQEHDYDVIISDIKMPGMDGLALLAKILELRPETPTLLITGHGEQQLAIQALRGGAYDYIQKPLDRDELVASLQRAIQTHQLRRQVKALLLSLELHAFSLERLVELCRHLIDEFTTGAGPMRTFEALGEPVEAEVDAERMSQVILQLLLHARKYSPRGSPITLTLQQRGYEATLAVRDRGGGIPAEMRSPLFEQDSRVPGIEGQDGSSSGMGLGLSLSRKIVERHGGHLAVESSPEHGSVCCLVLPLYIDPATDTLDAGKLARHTQAVWTIAH